MESKRLTIAEKETIERELREALDTLTAGCEKLDMELAFRIFADSPDFLMMGADGSLCDYQTYLKNNVDYLMDCSTFTLTTLQREYRILGSNTAILSWVYKAEAGFKNGERDVFDRAGASFVFRKMKDDLKVVYYHESSLPPRRENSSE
jgi:hypothetical protein